MLLKLPRKPSDRNMNIYYAVTGEETTRKEVAQVFNITKQRVGAIVRRVAKWIAKKGAENGTPLNEQRYLAEDAHLHSLRKHKKTALEMFDKSCEGRFAPDDSSTPKKWYPARPSAAFLAKAMAADKAICETVIARAKAGVELHKAYKETDEYWQRRDEKLMAKEARAEAKKASKASGVFRDKEYTTSIENTRERLPTPSRRDAKIDNLSDGSIVGVANKSKTTVRDNVVITLRRDDIPGVTSPVSDSKPALQAGDVRTTERADDTGYVPVQYDANGKPIPPAGAMSEIRMIDGERREYWKNAQGESIWCVETYDYGEDLAQPIESADGRCFSGKMMWRTEAEIDDEHRRRWAVK